MVGLLVFLVLVIGSSLLLYAWRAPRVGLGQRFAPLSREGMLLVNNMLLAVAAGAVVVTLRLPVTSAHAVAAASAVRLVTVGG